jgi:hypothetical protein
MALKQQSGIVKEKVIDALSPIDNGGGAVSQNLKIQSK